MPVMTPEIEMRQKRALCENRLMPTSARFSSTTKFLMVRHSRQSLLDSTLIVQLQGKEEAMRAISVQLFEANRVKLQWSSNKHYLRFLDSLLVDITHNEHTLRGHLTSVAATQRANDIIPLRPRTSSYIPHEHLTIGHTAKKLAVLPIDAELRLGPSERIDVGRDADSLPTRERLKTLGASIYNRAIERDSARVIYLVVVNDLPVPA